MNDAKYDFDGATKRCNEFCLICLTLLCLGQLAVLCCPLTGSDESDEAAQGQHKTARERCWSLTPRGCVASDFFRLSFVLTPRLERVKI